MCITCWTSFLSSKTDAKPSEKPSSLELFRGAKEEDEVKYALCDQIRRAVVSVPSNIAEGSGRKSLKEQIHFLEISYGSLMETYNQLLIAIDLTYITEESVEAIKPRIDAVAKMINGLSNSYSAKLNSGE